LIAAHGISCRCVLCFWLAVSGRQAETATTATTERRLNGSVMTWFFDTGGQRIASIMEQCGTKRRIGCVRICYSATLRPPHNRPDPNEIAPVRRLVLSLYTHIHTLTDTHTQTHIDGLRSIRSSPAESLACSLLLLCCSREISPGASSVVCNSRIRQGTVLRGFCLFFGRFQRGPADHLFDLAVTRARKPVIGLKTKDQ